MRRKCAVILLLFSILMPAGLYAQSSAGYRLQGHISDPEGEGYAHLEVTLFQLSRTTTTDETGRYRFDSVPEGVYALVFHHPYGEVYKAVTVEENTEYDVILRREIKYDEIVVTAVRSWDSAPFAKTKVDGESMRASHYGQDIPQLLNQTVSLVATSDAGTGIGYSGARIRGVDPARINVTLNGIPWNDAESHAVYWVDLPDLANSVSDLEVQRGVGSSTAGAGAFGAGISLNTNKLHLQPYAHVKGTVGAFGTRKGSVYLGTGLLEGQYTLDAGISQLNSEGYIDRSRASLRNLYLSGTRIKANSSLRFNLFSGQEVTGLAWYGVPYAYAMSDNQRTFNLAGTERSIQNPYDSTVDNYAQTHLQLFYNRSINRNSQLALTFFYTRGKGFYEQYKAEEKLSDYGLMHRDTALSDLIRKKWLSNHFGGVNYSWQHKGQDRPWSLIFGGSHSLYAGAHFGEVVATPQLTGVSPNLPYVYYDNDALKWDHTAYLKGEYLLLSGLSLYAEGQYRRVQYGLEGLDAASMPQDTAVTYDFMQPKAGLAYMRGSWHWYASYARASKEPTRADFRGAPVGKGPAPEHLTDYEMGGVYSGQGLEISLNGYYMKYRNQLVLTGKLSDVGEYIRTNAPNSYRTGLEAQLGGMWQGVKWQANGHYSQNKSGAFIEYVDDWDSGQQITREYRGRDLAFSPRWVGGASLDYPVDLPFGRILVGGAWKYVGAQYLDNTQSEKARLEPYQYLNGHLGYTLSRKPWKDITARLTLLNVGNTRYSSGGWVYRFYTTHPEWIKGEDKPSLVAQGDGFYNLIGLYPQATRHWMLTLEMKF